MKANRQKKKPALYSVGTWDADMQAYTPQVGLTVPSQNVPLWTMAKCLRELKRMGYSCHRRRDEDGNHDDNDFYVLVERTGGLKMNGRR